MCSKGTCFPAIDKSQQLTKTKRKNGIFWKNNQNTLLAEPNSTVAIKSPQPFAVEDLIEKCNLLLFLHSLPHPNNYLQPKTDSL